jgi:hypothetical protein
MLALTNRRRWGARYSLTHVLDGEGSPDQVVHGQDGAGLAWGEIRDQRHDDDWDHRQRQHHQRAVDGAGEPLEGLAFIVRQLPAPLA